MTRKARQLYLSAPVDEIELAARVLPLIQALDGHLPDTAFFQKLSAQEGLDYATMALHLAIRRMNGNRKFISELESMPINPDTSDSGQRVVLIPALFYAEHPEVGADGQIALDVARKLGFDAVRAPTKSMGSMSGNAVILHEFLHSLPPRPTILVSLSRGTGEVRLFFDRFQNDAVLESIQGWVNICGLVNGTPIHDMKTRNRWETLKYRAIVALLGGKFSDFLDLCTTHPHWRRPLMIPPHVTVINALGTPLPCHMQTHLMGRYRSLAAFGPNDGMNVCRNALLPGCTYPIWGADHFFRSYEVSSFLYRLFRWIRQRSASVKDHRREATHAA